jgi:hypothetical protein
MKLRSMLWAISAATFSLSGAAGCEEKPAQPLAPVSSSLAPPEKPAAAQSFAIEAAGSKITFVMNAPLEKISGEAPDSAGGELHLDLSNLTKSAGLIKVDLDKLTLYQAKRDKEEEVFGERSKSDKQNEHARSWLEIADDAPPETREKHRWVEFKIQEVTNVQPQADVTKMTGPERKVTAVIKGDFRLHERVSQKQALIEATFKFDGDKPQAVTIKTTQPMSVGLEEHDVRPRDAFGKLAKKTLDELGSKVAKEAPIELELTARAK